MKVEFENDLENNLMKMTITTEKRKRVNHDKIIIGWEKAFSILSERYKPPEKYILGECHNKYLIIDNDNNNRLASTWVFNLEQIVKPSKRIKKTVKK
jgi:hypothetical protein